MNRLSFLKNLIAGFGAVAIAPKVLAEIKPELKKLTSKIIESKTFSKSRAVKGYGFWLAYIESNDIDYEKEMLNLESVAIEYHTPILLIPTANINESVMIPSSSLEKHLPKLIEQII